MPQATLTVWKFARPVGADEAVHTLFDMEKQGLVTVVDFATVAWAVGRKKPTTQQSAATVAAGSLGGAFWGMLFGLIFFVPLLGAAVGAATGGLAGWLTDVGIDDGFIEEVRSEVMPGTSALFVMTSGAVLDRVQEGFAARQSAELIHTNLSPAQEATLREVFED